VAYDAWVFPLPFDAEAGDLQMGFGEPKRLVEMVPQLGFRETLDALPAAIYVTDAQGKITYFNPACVAFSGRTPEIGSDHWCVTWKLFYPDGTPMPHDRCPMAVALKEGRVIRGEEAIAERPDGTRVWFEPYPTPLRDETGRIIGGINMLVETTERERADEAQARLAAIVESSDDGIIGKNLDGIITSWNRGAARLFGYSAEEAIGRPVTMLMPPDRVNEEPAILERIRRGETIDHYETVRRRKDGTLLDISLTVSPVFDGHGRIVGASKIARDITERKRTERALRDADRKKDEFLATLAHELRNPLAPIMNAVELLNHIGATSPDAVRARGTIQRQISHLTRLVEDLLNISRISSGKLDLRRQPVELASVINAAVETCQPVVERFKHELTVTLPPQPVWIDGDPVRLAQVIGNLCNNACKYTPPNGRVSISAHREGSDAVVTVRDSGIGIPADKLESVFDLFAQVNPSPEREQGGLGIGLHLVKRLVEIHGGTVTARSAGVGAGSEFTVRLPAVIQAAVSDKRPAEPPPPTPTPTNANELKAGGLKRRILIVDDNRDAARMLSRLLSLSGHQTQLAFDGEEAVEQAMKFVPDVVLLDIGLPKLNGYDACRAILGNSKQAKPHVVALTGWGQDDDRAKSRDAGFHAHLTKPVSFEELKTLLVDLPDECAAGAGAR
jgi:PAS domain S-box-containing protein